MKTQLRVTRKNILTIVGFIVMMVSLANNTAYAQSQKMSTSETAQQGKTIKGIVTNEEGPLESASVILKGTNIGTTTDEKGEFNFPKPLTIGDILLVSYLGFETVEVKIKDNTTFLRIAMTEDLLEFVGALNTDKPYKSKRSN